MEKDGVNGMQKNTKNQNIIKVINIPHIHTNSNQKYENKKHFSNPPAGSRNHIM